MFKNLQKNAVALSPIFAALIILAVVTVLFIPVFIWASGMSSQTQNSWQLEGLTATERIAIEEVNLKAGQQYCTIYVRNIGKTDIAIDTVVMFTSDGDIHYYQKSKNDPNFNPTYQLIAVEPSTTTPLISVVPGELVEIKIPNIANSDPIVNPPFQISSDTYTIKVSTIRGVSDTYQVVA